MVSCVIKSSYQTGYLNSTLLCDAFP